MDGLDGVKPCCLLDKLARAGDGAARLAIEAYEFRRGPIHGSTAVEQRAAQRLYKKIASVRSGLGWETSNPARSRNIDGSQQ